MSKDIQLDQVYDKVEIGKDHILCIVYNEHSFTTILNPFGEKKSSYIGLQKQHLLTIQDIA